MFFSPLSRCTVWHRPSPPKDEDEAAGEERKASATAVGLGASRKVRCTGLFFFSPSSHLRAAGNQGQVGTQAPLGARDHPAPRQAAGGAGRGKLSVASSSNRVHARRWHAIDAQEVTASPGAVGAAVGAGDSPGGFCSSRFSAVWGRSGGGGQSDWRRRAARSQVQDGLERSGEEKGPQASGGECGGASERGGGVEGQAGRRQERGAGEQD